MDELVDDGSVEVLVWAKGEAIDPPSRWAQAGTIGLHVVAVLGAIVAGFAADTRLCPEHRALVDLGAGIGFFLTIAALFGALRARAWATWALIGGACATSAVALLEMAHGIAMPAIFLPAQLACLVIGAFIAAQRRQAARTLAGTPLRVPPVVPSTDPAPVQGAVVATPAPPQPEVTDASPVEVPSARP